MSSNNTKTHPIYPFSVGNQSFDEFWESYLTDYGESSKYKYKGPIFDGHTHVWKVDKYILDFSKEFGIEKVLAIVDENLQPKMDEMFPDTFYYARFIRSKDLYQGKVDLIHNMLDEFVADGYTRIKFWFAPRFIDFMKERFGMEPIKIGLADPIFDPFFSALQDRNLPLLIHSSDPDIWYQKKYQPESKYGSKMEHLKDLETVLQRYPDLIIQGAHLAAQAEHLDNISRWLDTYPNFTADLSSARWMAREFSKQPEKAREFLIKYADRVFWGSDLSYGHENTKENRTYFYTRYLTYRALFETKVKNLPLPFEDSENDNATVINGLNLPEDVLEKLYWKTALNFFN